MAKLANVIGLPGMPVPKVRDPEAGMHLTVKGGATMAGGSAGELAQLHRTQHSKARTRIDRDGNAECFVCSKYDYVYQSQWQICHTCWVKMDNPDAVILRTACPRGAYCHFHGAHAKSLEMVYNANVNLCQTHSSMHVREFRLMNRLKREGRIDEVHPKMKEERRKEGKDWQEQIGISLGKPSKESEQMVVG